MTDQKHSNQITTFIAIDIAKRSHDVLIKFPDSRTKTLKIPNTLDGYERLMEALSDIPVSQIRFGFEPTADYHRNIAYWLAQQGLSAHLISSLACARAREMLYKSRDKNDRKDARVILYLLENGISKPFYDPLLRGSMDVQELCNTYQQITLARSRCFHSLLNHYLTLYFPEIERYLHNSRSEWFCRFLLKFPIPATITRYRQAIFVKKAWDIVGRKVSKQAFLEEVYELAQRSTGLPLPSNSLSVDTFKMQLDRYLNLTIQRRELENLAVDQLSGRSDYQRLTSIPGIGPIIALIIIAESGDLRRFSHYRQYLNFCGFNLAGSQSGSRQGSYSLSKRGNARLRYAYWLAANSAIRHTENSFRAKYSRCIQSDPDNADLKRKARVAVAIKVARVAHSLIKNDRNYRGYHEFGYGT